MKPLLYLLLTALCLSCARNSTTEKHQNNRNNVVNVHDKIREINTGDVFISSVARLYTMDKYLFIADHNSPDLQIHIFDKNTFAHITSFAPRGQGPGEIANMGLITPNEAGRSFFLSDHGKQRIFSYHLDSLLAGPLSYMPQVKITINEKAFPSEYVYINDTLSIGRIIEPDGKGDFRQSAGKWNMTTGQISIMPYSGPKGVHKKRATLAASAGHDIYVECHRFYNLMTICNFNGELICNIFGPNWDGQYDGRIEQFGRVEICGDKIVALYSGERAVYENATTTNLPSRFLVFSISGDYLQTIETGYNISDFRYDPGKNRIIMNLDDEMQFAYLDLDGII